MPDLQAPNDASSVYLSCLLQQPIGGRVLETNPIIERWRLVVVLLATIAALPLFLFENPNSTGSLTGVAGAGTTAAPGTSALLELNGSANDQRVAEGELFLLNRAENWHSARTTWNMVERLQSAAVKYEEEAMEMAREISDAEFAEKEKQMELEEAQELRRKLFAEEDARRERVMSTLGPTTTIVATEPDPDGPANVQWEALRYCESTENYQAVSPTGMYRGAYQFSVETWDWIAGLYYEHLVGVDPAEARPSDQDRMAQSLYLLRGRGQWPVCGRYLP
jgi:hypothetical protein